MDKREKILNVAIKLFAERGFEGTSTRDICKLANVNISMISYYFNSKQGLYDAIVSKFIGKIKSYMQALTDFDADFESLSQEEKIKIVYLMADKLVDFFYRDIPPEQLKLILQEQQKPDSTLKSPPFEFIMKLLASIFNKKSNDKEIVFKALCIASVIAFPRVMAAVTLNALGQKKFDDEDIKIIKQNSKLNVDRIFSELEVKDA